MMRASLMTVGVLASALALGTGAVAQPRGGRPSRPPTAPPPAASPGAGVPPAIAPDAGPVPPPTEAGDGGTRWSPLNPAPDEFSDAGQAPASVDYDRLLGDIASLRARAAAVSDVLFHCRLAISVETVGDHGRITGLSVGLDDGTVWTSPPTFRAESPVAVYDHAVAPGHHAVTIDVERHDDRDEAFRSSQRSRFVVEVPADARLSLDIKLWDESSIGGSFSSDKNGKYDLRVRASARVQPLAQGK
jgi:hypothetical protein